jgi:hypothetical protein
MTIQNTTLRPGLLVSLKTSVRGNVKYLKDQKGSQKLEDGAEVALWETQRTIKDPVEHKAAGDTRTRARYLVRSICAESAFGLLCPETDKDKLEKAVAEARKLAEEFNETAKLSKISVFVITGRIAPDDVEAVRAINDEIRGLMDDMNSGIERLDAKSIREAASKIKDVGQMLSADMQARIQIAIETARGVAKKIKAAGEQAAQEIDRSAIRKITEMRTAFLDLDGGAEVAAPAAEARALDLAPVDTAPIAAPVAKAPALEVE